MPKLPPPIASMAIGSLLSMTLLGCVRQVPVAKSVPVAVQIRDTPPAELLRCPVAPVGYPADAEATMPATVRAATIRMATALRETRDQLLRLIGWHDATACKDMPR